MSSDATNAGNPASGPVLGTDPAYPKYAVEFSGGNVRVDAPVLVTGPHTHTFFLQPGDRAVTVELSRIASDGVRPNLRITLT
jgi:hypothetical protein